MELSIDGQSVLEAAHEQYLQSPTSAIALTARWGVGSPRQPASIDMRARVVDRLVMESQPVESEIEVKFSG